MTRELKIALPLLVLVASLAAAYALITTGPQAERRPPPPVIPLIEIETVRPTSYRVEVESRGTVSPRTQSTLVPEVAGLIVDVAPSMAQAASMALPPFFMMSRAICVASGWLVAARVRGSSGGASGCERLARSSVPTRSRSAPRSPSSKQAGWGRRPPRPVPTELSPGPT